MIESDVLDEILVDKTLRAMLLPEEPMFWLDFYFVDEFWTPQDYEEIIDWIEKWKNLIWFWYRGCAKTSIIRKRICKNIAIKKNKFVRWTSYDVQKAEDNITSISNMLIGTPESLFINDYWRLYYNESVMNALFRQKEQKRTSWFNATNWVVVKANSVKKSTRWLNVFIRNKSIRPDLDVLDDIDDDENTQNPNIITKTYNKVKGAIFGWSVGQKIILWNTINEDWVLPRLANDVKDNPRRKVVYTKFLKDDGSLHRPERFVRTRAEADVLNTKLWQNLIQSLEDIREEQGRDRFGANYMLVPLRTWVSVIEEERIRYKDYVPINYWHQTYISVDNAESENDNTDPIWLSVWTWMPEKGKRNIRYSWQLKWRQKDLKRVEDKLVRLSETYNTKNFIIENKAGWITLRKYLIQKHPDWQIFLYDPRKLSKIWRLRQVQPYIESSKIEFSPDIDQSFIKELVKFPNIDNDDRIDAFTALILKHKNSLMQMEKENEVNTKSIESWPKNNIPNKDNSKDRALELINKYTPKKNLLNNDF